MKKPSMRKFAVAAVIVLVCGLVPLCAAGCAPQTTGSLSSTSNGEGTAEQAEDAPVMEGDFTFSADADCAVCHTTQGESLADATMPASNHAAVGCTTCHSDIDGLTQAHDGVAYGDKTAKRLKSTAVDTTACQNDACHGSLADLAEKTAACTVLTDTNDTVVNPHDLPVNDDHATIDCGSCHSMHDDASVDDTAKKACKGCHHMEVYECYTCHE